MSDFPAPSLPLALLSARVLTVVEQSIITVPVEIVFSAYLILFLLEIQLFGRVNEVGEHSKIIEQIFTPHSAASLSSQETLHHMVLVMISPL